MGEGVGERGVRCGGVASRARAPRPTAKASAALGGLEQSSEQVALALSCRRCCCSWPEERCCWYHVPDIAPAGGGGGDRLELLTPGHGDTGSLFTSEYSHEMYDRRINM